MYISNGIQNIDLFTSVCEIIVGRIESLDCVENVTYQKSQCQNCIKLFWFREFLKQLLCGHGIPVQVESSVNVACKIYFFATKITLCLSKFYLRL